MKAIPLGVAFLCVLLATRPSAAAEHYVAVDGKAGNAGTEAAPWDLASALGGARQVAPGDTIWVRAGAYKHPDRRPGGNGYLVKLAGATGKPIHVRAVPGERVTVDGGLRVENPSKFLWIWDIEIIVSENLTHTRVARESGSHSPSRCRSMSARAKVSSALSSSSATLRRGSRGEVGYIARAKRRE